MAIPDFQSLMMPIVEFCADGKEHASQEAIEAVAQRFKLSPEERKQLLPSGRQRIFDNRISWARAYLHRAGLLEIPRHGIFRITNRAKELPAKNWIPITSTTNWSRAFRSNAPDARPLP